jgi:hypothetical protein
MATATVSAQPQGGGPAAASTVERGSCPGNRRLAPTFLLVTFARWTLATAGVAAYAARSEVLGSNAPIESAQRGARYRIASWRLILLPDATRLSPHTARLRKTPGRPWALLGAGARPISKTPL